MNKKLSGAQLVLVPIQNLGANKFPFVENISRRHIKYIDFHAATYLPGTTATGTTSTDNMYVTIMNTTGTDKRINSLPLAQLDYAQTLGIRQQIDSRISMQDSYVECQNPAMVGTVAAFIFYYDLPEYSRKSNTNVTVIDSLSIPITNVLRYNQLPDNDRMTGKRFRRILVNTPSVTPDYKTGIDAAKLPNVYLTLRKGSYNVVENLPLSLLYQMKMIEKTEFANICFDFQSSFLTVGGNGTVADPTDYIGKAVFINLEYEQE